MNESFFPLAFSSSAAAVEHVDRERAEARGRRDRAALVHELDERRRGPADRRRLAGAPAGRPGGCGGRAVALDGCQYVLLRDPPRGPVPGDRVESTPWALAMRRGHRGGVAAVAGGWVRCVRLSGLRGGLDGAVPCGRGRRPAPAAIRHRIVPTLTVSSASTRTSWTVPATGEGTSASTLSVEISTSGSSTARCRPASRATRARCPRRPSRPSPGRRRRRARPRRVGLRRLRGLVGLRRLVGLARPRGRARRRSRSRRAPRRPERSSRAPRGSSPACRPPARAPRRRPCPSRSRRAARRPPRDRQPA